MTVPCGKEKRLAGLLLVTLGGVLVVASAGLANIVAQPVFNPKMTVTQASKAVRIDGDLEDPAWNGAEMISHFVERSPGDNTQPEVATKTYVTYDDDKLYVAFVCLDDPRSLRSTMCQRDQFTSDDAVIVLIDTYGEAAWAYEFLVNPLGVQKDRLWSSVGGEDPGFDLIWESAAKVTDSGYQVELAVPFESLRFPNRDRQSWRVDFWRNRPRESMHQYSWAAYDRNEQCWPCQWGTLEGIADVRPGRGLEILPTFVANQAGALSDASDPLARIDNGDVYGAVSLGAKYALATDATIEAAYNPDFSQIEADAAQVDVNTTIALIYPERRPFFQEGADVFRTLFNSFYTRTVNDPEYAVKLISRKQGYTLGFMSARDENTPYMIPLEESSILRNVGCSQVNVLRGSKAIGDASQLGFIVTDRRFENNGYGTIAAVDGNIRLTRNLAVDGQFLASFTGEPDQAGATAGLSRVSVGEGSHSAAFDGESFRGNAFISRLKRFARHWSFLIDYNQVAPSYRTQTGYDPWVDYRNASVWTQYTFYPESGMFQRIQPQVYADSRWRFDGVHRWEHQNFSLDAELRWAQTHVSIYAGRGRETWTSRLVDTLIDYHGLYSAGLRMYSQPNRYAGCEVSAEIGRSVARFADAIGDEFSVDASLDLKPIDRIVIEPQISYARSAHTVSGKQLYQQFIARTRLRLQVNRELSVRLVVQYDDSKASILAGRTPAGPTYFDYKEKVWNIDPLITYRLSPFSVLYVGSTHDYTKLPSEDPWDLDWRLSERQFFVKLQYLFQV
ncbi:MAG: carbohydrate binding family 9 domain-containing protein [bacterium]